MQIASEPTLEPSTPAGELRDAKLKFAFILIFAAVIAALIILQVYGINGSPYGPWVFWRIPWWRIFPAMLLAGGPFFFVLIALARGEPRRPSAAIIALMVSTFAMQLVVAGSEPRKFDLFRVVTMVSDRYTTSYFTDAELLSAADSLKDWLDNYDAMMPTFTFHSKEKPPGPVLFYVLFLRLTAPGESGLAALRAAWAIAALTTIAIPAVYLFTRLITRDPRIALVAAAYISVSPCLVVFLPMFDAFYITFSCGMLATWVLAMRDNRHWASMAFGAVMAMAVFFSYCHLVLGAFVLAYAFVQIRARGRPAAIQFLIHSAIAMGTLAAIYGVFYLLTGFDPIATFFSAVENQRKLLQNLIIPRPYPMTIPTDLQDFFLGTAWISLPLLCFWLLRQRNAPSTHLRTTIFVGLFQIAVLALSGLMPGETARVWMFLQPLTLIPIASELMHWPRWQRASVLGIVWFLTTLAAQNMVFVRIDE